MDETGATMMAILFGATFILLMAIGAIWLRVRNLEVQIKRMRSDQEDLTPIPIRVMRGYQTAATVAGSDFFRRLTETYAKPPVQPARVQTRNDGKRYVDRDALVESEMRRISREREEALPPVSDIITPIVWIASDLSVDQAVTDHDCGRCDGLIDPDTTSD